MVPSNSRTTFMVLIGYIILGVLATISGFLVFSEIKTFTNVQKQGISDKSKILKTGSLIADIYKNESLARAAIQLNSTRKFNEYLSENEKFISKIDSLNLVATKKSQEFILDSIKLIIDKKLKNITDLKKLKSNTTVDKSIIKAISKLSSIDSLLGKVTVGDLVKDPLSLDSKTRQRFEEYVQILNKYNPQDSIGSIGQKQIDSLLSISRNILKEAQDETNNQRLSQQLKERELIENDLTISRKLQELLRNLEKDILLNTNNMNKQREETLNHSKNIILFAAGVSFVIIIVFSIIIFNDFWKTQRYRKQLELANETTSSLLKSREHLISMVSHDLRTPLSTISGFSELLQKSLDNNKYKNYIEHIRSASTYMGQLVDDLLEFSKLENGNHVAIESIPFNLQKLIDEIVQNGKTIVKDKPITFVVKHEESINKLLVGDPFRMKQILHNLVTNACKFTTEGTITIQSFFKEGADKNILEIEVSDTGIGVSKEHEKHIFNAFSQANENNEGQQKGFGLGLTISKKLAELLGGTIALKSELNQGSTFILKVPIALSNELVSPADTPTQEFFFGLRALVVEDDVSLQQLLISLLQQFGIKTTVFSDAKSALKKLNETSYDFVLTDIQLPKMNGIHFMETLVNQPSYSKQPVIAMTGRANMYREDYMNIGFSEVLIKPFDYNEIQSVLNKLFENSISKKHVDVQEVVDKQENDFSIASIKSFFNNDMVAIKETLRTFLDDSYKNHLQLVEARNTNDVEKFNNISHKMLGMFKQLDVKKLVPFLEAFEISDKIDPTMFSAYEKHIDNFFASMKNYLS